MKTVNHGKILNQNLLCVEFISEDQRNAILDEQA
jgi:hypothetical protein